MNQHRRAELKRARRKARIDSGRRKARPELTDAQATTRDLITYRLHRGRLAVQDDRAATKPRLVEPGSRAAGPVRLLNRMEIPREFRPPLLPGKDSRRERAQVWVPVEPNVTVEQTEREAA